MNFRKTKDAKVKVSKKDVLSDDEFEPKNVKERITIFIDQDILDEFRSKAKNTKKKYQTLINDTLREAISKPSLEDRVKVLEKKIAKIAS